MKLEEAKANTPAKAEEPKSHPALFIVYALVVLYALCYQLQSPVEPFLVEKLLKSTDGDASAADSAVAYGQLKSFFSICQSVGSLAFGYILDKWGVRTGLIINFSACALSYFLLSITDSIELLFLSRVPGVAMAGFLCAQTATIRLTPPGAQRLKALGRLTSAYTIGGVVGPYLGGQLGSSGNYFIGAQCACAGSLLAVVLVFFIPASIDSSVGDEKPAEGAEKKSPELEGSWMTRAFSILQLVWLFLFVKVVTSIANSMARSSQPLILKDLGCDEAMLGTVMSAQFAFGGFANAFLLGPVTSVMGGQVSKVVRNCVIVMGGGYVLQAYLYSDNMNILPTEGTARVYPFIGIIMLLAIFQYSLGTSITAKTSDIVPKAMQGTLIGMEHSLFAVAYMTGPQLGVAALQAGGISGVSSACACVFFFVFLVWLIFAKGRINPKFEQSNASDANDDKAGKKE